MIFVQVCSCVRPAPEDAQLCSEHPVLHDVRGDGADLARHGEQPENRERIISTNPHAGLICFQY